MQVATSSTNNFWQPNTVRRVRSCSFLSIKFIWHKKILFFRFYYYLSCSLQLISIYHFNAGLWFADSPRRNLWTTAYFLWLHWSHFTAWTKDLSIWGHKRWLLHWVSLLLKKLFDIDECTLIWTILIQKKIKVLHNFFISMNCNTCN